MFALNFYSEVYADALLRGRKGATIRLGDKSDKYRSGQIVWITAGRRYYEDNLSPDVSPQSNYFDQSLVDILVKGQGTGVPSKIW